VEIYEDKDNARKDEINTHLTAPTQSGLFSKYYERLKEVYIYNITLLSCLPDCDKSQIDSSTHYSGTKANDAAYYVFLFEMSLLCF